MFAKCICWVILIKFIYYGDGLFGINAFVRVSCRKFFHFDIYLIVLFLYHQSDFLSISLLSVCLSEARGHYRPAPRMFRLSVSCVQKAGRTRTGSDPISRHHQIATQTHVQVCIGLHIGASSDIKRQSDPRCHFSCDGRLRRWGPLCSAYLNQDVKSCLVIVKLKQLFN